LGIAAQEQVMGENIEKVSSGLLWHVSNVPEVCPNAERDTALQTHGVTAPVPYCLLRILASKGE
jgi:hypothetical protein